MFKKIKEARWGCNSIRKNLFYHIADFFYRLGDKADPSKNLDEDKKAELKKDFEAYEKEFWETNEALGLPPLDAKNPYRFM